MGKRMRRLWVVLLILYILVMVYLLLLDRPVLVQRSINLVPLRTVQQFEYLLRQQNGVYLTAIAFVNLAGNVVLFVPLGFLPPMVWPKLRTWLRTLGIAAGAVICVEAAQYFLYRGAADVDDLLLNLLGAAIGFLIFRITERIYAKRHPV